VINEIKVRFRKYVTIRWSDVLLLPREYAIAFIKECQKESIIILGIDGFYLTPTTVQPSMDNSINFSDPESEEYKTKDRYQSSINFLEERDPKMYFEIVCKTNNPNRTG